MTVRCRIATLLLTMLSAAGALQAQDERRISLVVDGNGTAGLLIPITDGIALRPDFTYGRSSISSGRGLSGDSYSAMVGLSVLRYLSSEERLRTYVVPRVGHSWGSASNMRAYDLSASFGGHADVVRRLGLFAETGVRFGYSETRIDVPIVGEMLTISRNWRLISNVGATIRF